jgi:RNA polymerase sigma-70 factor (ECF subfamily)
MIAALVDRARDDSLPVDQQHAAFAELVRRFEEAAFAWAVQRVHDPEEARDVCQEAFVTAWLKLRQLRDPAAFAGWLRRIVSRAGVEDRQSCLPGQAGLPVLHSYTIVTTLLNEQERRILTLHYHLGYKLDEIAAMLHLPRGTVGKRLYTARIKIRRTLPRGVRLQFQRPPRTFLQQVREGLFDEYTGTYRFVKRPELTVTIRREGDQLVSDSNGQRSVLASLRENALVATAYDAEGRFERDRRGRIVQFVYYEFGERLGVAKRVRE